MPKDPLLVPTNHGMRLGEAERRAKRIKGVVVYDTRQEVYYSDTSALIRNFETLVHDFTE